MDNILKEFNLNEYHKELFQKYYSYLIAENKKVNLTSITDEKQVYIKHFYDSLLVSKTIDLNEINNICDIGSGAGFPGIPLKILYPHLNLIIIEPTLKRVRFLNELIEILKLENCLVIKARAEDIIEEYRDYFDLVTARAVARLNILLELCLPFVKVGGKFLALKGSSYQSELNESIYAIKELSGDFTKVDLYELPDGLGMRSILEIKKVLKSNFKYPRHYSKIKKKPL